MKTVLTYDELYPVYHIDAHKNRQEIIDKVEAHEAALAACATEEEREALRNSANVPYYDMLLDIPCEIALNYHKAYAAFIKARAELERAIHDATNN